MRILGVGDSNDLGAMYLALAADGHECRVSIADAEAADTLAGLVPRTLDWRAELSWIHEAGSEGLIVFETAHDGVVQDGLRAEGFHVIGGSAYGDRLENDRAFGQQAMADAGMQTAATHHFEDFAVAIAFVRATRGQFVFKVSAAGYASYRNYVGAMPDGSDMVAYLEQQARRLQGQPTPAFILMEYLQGVEVGVGGYFDGRRFLAPVCLDWEHKRFFNGDLGELTGEMGTLVTYRGSEALFAATLARMAEPLARSGYVGYININTIVNQRGVWPLEFTCRFGYPGFAILSALHDCGWADVFRCMIARADGSFATRAGYAVGIVLTVPPFPYSHGYAELSKGMPVAFAAELTAEDHRHLHYGEMALEGGQLVTAGVMGYIMVVTGAGDAVDAARRDAYARAAKVHVANVRYRTDIGMRFVDSDRDKLTALGWL